MSAEQLKELIPFLHDANPQVRQIALANLLGHTPKGSANREIFFTGLRGGGMRQQEENGVVHDLKLLCRDQLATAHDAFRALINLSDYSLIIGTLSDPDYLCFLVSYILNPQSILADLASMLLSNLTASTSTCSTLLGLNVKTLPDSKSPTAYFPVQSQCGTCPAPVPYPKGDPRSVHALPPLLDAFVQGASVEETQDVEKRVRRGSLHFLSSVFANLSTTPAGRMFFLTPRPTDPLKSSDEGLEYPLTKLLVFTEHKDTIRRGGVASTLKNCAFHVQAHRAMLSPEKERVAVPPSTVEAPGMDVLPYLLLPLAGPEEFDLEDQELLPPALQFLPSTKQREPDPVLRLTHVETLLLLCTTRWGRDYLRNHGVYEIVRALHENEEVDKISEHVERLVNFLKRAEGTGTEVDLIDTGEGTENHESDDEDNRIEKI
ncbi:DUF383-domain-containing protein [Laetiporus sulphureus 93-53]|uniref:Protein HGH1 homolog n=1 Tax=Laetiporus sulphureus 93-53 TaxID=1314785 RepID=A0A165G4N2_9APHY|nr:DUF383-domain-containing protein [Laetiporus sulphureus 93-53]KZT09824.1 DUF383-domain-containing protein [Laetiporus sulphureus 93-53]